MKARKLLLLVVMCLTTFLTGFGEPEKPKEKKDTTPKTGTGILRLVSRDSGKKRLPSKNFLDLYYEDGVLTLESTTTDGEFSIDLINLATSQTEYIPAISTGESICVDLDCGIYDITAESNGSATYAGQMEIQ